MNQIKKNQYWIPLIEYSNQKQKLIWTGKTITIPINIKISKEKLIEGFGISPSSTILINYDDFGLFVEIEKKKYLLGIGNIYKSQDIKGDYRTSINSLNYLKEEDIQEHIKTEINKEFTEKNIKSKKKGMEIRLKGRIGGASKALKMKLKTGSYKPQSIETSIDYASSGIKTKWGILGLKVFLT